MKLNSILQWNLQSYFTKFSNLKLLLQKYRSACMTLPKTMIKERKCNPPSRYTIYKSNILRNDEQDRGAKILAHKGYIIKNVQATAISIYLSKRYTSCSVYLPHHQIAAAEVEALINQLPSPFIVMGDFNARSRLWLDIEETPRGKMIEQLILDNDWSILNNGQPTHYYSQTNTESVIDLTICSPECRLAFQYEVLDQLWGSDHYPVVLETIIHKNDCKGIVDFSTEKADWSLFKVLTMINENVNMEEVEELAKYATENITAAASIAIPRKSTSCTMVDS